MKNICFITRQRQLVFIGIVLQILIIAELYFAPCGLEIIEESEVLVEQNSGTRTRNDPFLKVILQLL